MNKRNVVIYILGTIVLIVCFFYFNKDEINLGNDNNGSSTNSDAQEYEITINGENLFIEVPNVIHDISYNSYKVVPIVGQEFAEFYYYRFRVLLRYDLKKAKSLVYNIDNINDLAKYFNKEIVSYKITGADGNYTLIIVDSDETNYEFNIRAVNQYSLTITEKELETEM